MNFLKLQTGCALCTLALFSSWGLGVFGAGAAPVMADEDQETEAALAEAALAAEDDGTETFMAGEEPGATTGDAPLANAPKSALNGPGQQNSPVGIAVDSQGNAYLTGEWVNSGGNYDFTTVKYDSAGKQVWVRLYNGPAQGNDRPMGIAVDSSGNSYVTGASQGDNQQHDFATVKYDSAGKQTWVQRHNGPYQGDDWPTGIAVDSSGNAYVTGDHQITNSQWDFTTIKYNPGGKPLWMKRYNGPYQGSSRPAAIAVDSAGMVYVSGDSQTAASQYDFATVKYDSSGKQVWSKRFTRAGSSYNFPSGIALTPSGNVYVAGSTSGATTSGDYTIINYNAAGQRVWSKCRDSQYGYDHATGIGVDKKGSAYVTGGAGNGDFMTVKYDSSGKLVWQRNYDGTGHGYDYATAIALDSAGNAYVTGQSYGSNADFATIKYGPYGTSKWVSHFNGQGNGQDTPVAIAVDSAGNAYVTGQSAPNLGVAPFATVKYDSSGKQTWVTYYSGQ